MLSSSGVATRSVECGVDNEVSAGSCSDESHELLTLQSQCLFL